MSVIAKYFRWCLNSHSTIDLGIDKHKYAIYVYLFQDLLLNGNLNSTFSQTSALTMQDNFLFHSKHCITSCLSPNKCYSFHYLVWKPCKFVPSVEISPKQRLQQTILSFFSGNVIHFFS